MVNSLDISAIPDIISLDGDMEIILEGWGYSIGDVVNAPHQTPTERNYALLQVTVTEKNSVHSSLCVTGHSQAPCCNMKG
jgi:hypothetical protein